jgi:lipid A ethanolaminephosphotransferase
MSMRQPLSNRTRAATEGVNPLTLAALAGLWIAALPNWPLWRALLALPETQSTRGALFMLGFGVMIAALTTVLLAPLAWRATIKPAIAFLLLAAAFGAHFMGTYGVVIDTTMMINVVQTDPREVRDLLSLRLLGSVLLLAGLPLLALWRIRLRRSAALAQAARNAIGLVAAVLVLAALVFMLFADLSTTMRNHRSMRYLINPVNSLYALVDLSVQARSKPSGPPQRIGADARVLPRAPGVKPPLLMLVIGETARADHFSLNGYARRTNPELAAVDVLSFRDVTSCGTSTATSLPCMFSHLGKASFESRERDHENLLDLAQHAGMAVLWVDNQAGCKGLCDRVPSADARKPAVGGPAMPPGLCDGEECLDEALLIGLDARIAALPASARERGVLLVLHQMGSHGPAYYKRSPADRKPFQPECTTNVLQQCDAQALVNAYDNSIAYTDHVLASALKWLEAQRSHHEAALLYVSDHGESLGANNLYLHGLPFALAPREQTHVPMLLWRADWAGAAARMPRACLEGQLDAPLTHDHLFHSVLGLLGIQAGEYRPALDAFAACRLH